MTQLWRVEVTEEGQPPLPAVHVAAPFVIGSSITARMRLPAAVAQPEHVRVEEGRYTLDGVAHDIGTGAALDIGAYRITLAPAAADAAPTPPQRTESLARELMRSLLGTAGAPTLEITNGPLAGAKRPLQPPDSTLVIGRGDEATWIIADDDLSRVHAEIRRTLDGITIVDLDSKNGTKVDDEPVEGEHPLRDGARIELGKLAFLFRDPSEQQLASLAAPAPSGKARPRSASGSPMSVRRSPAQPRRSSATRGELRTPGRPGLASTLPFYAALGIMVVALAGLVWILSS